MNPKQQEAVENWQGPTLILAGAGSGKTRVLAYRIAYMIARCNIKPWNIMAVTFTNKAAREMRDRVEGLLGSQARDVMLGTFHSFCLRILRRECHQIGFERDFVVYDSDDQLRLVKSVLHDLQINEKTTPPRSVKAKISTLFWSAIEACRTICSPARPCCLFESATRDRDLPVPGRQ